MDSVDEKVDFEYLGELLLNIISELEKREEGMKFGDFERDVQLLSIACTEIWREKEDWKRAYFGLADRYMKTLDSANERLKSLIKIK